MKTVRQWLAGHLGIVTLVALLLTGIISLATYSTANAKSYGPLESSEHDKSEYMGVAWLEIWNQIGSKGGGPVAKCEDGYGNDVGVSNPLFGNKDGAGTRFEDQKVGDVIGTNYSLLKVKCFPRNDDGSADESHPFDFTLSWSCGSDDKCKLFTSSAYERDDEGYNDDLKHQLYQAICTKNVGGDQSTPEYQACLKKLINGGGGASNQIPAAVEQCASLAKGKRAQCMFNVMGTDGCSGFQCLTLDELKKLLGEWDDDQEADEAQKHENCLNGQLSDCTKDWCQELIDSKQQVQWDNNKGCVYTNADPDKEKSTCDIKVFGFVICPLIKFGGNLVDGLYDMIDDILFQIPADKVFGTGSGPFKAYRAFLPIANILLAIVFLLIIYSEATGNGFGALSNYSVKKLLPRLIIFAILVNVSWWICAAAVDISNIIGGNILEFIDGTKGSIREQMNQASSNNLQWTNLAAAAVVAAGGAGAVAVLGQVALIGPVLILAIVAVFILFIILIARQALVILLVVIAPIAIALALLPNTQSWFKKWMNGLVAMLVLYPEVSLLVGICQLASTILWTQDGSFLLKVASPAIRIVPLIAAPFIVFSSFKAFGAAGSAISKFGRNRLKGSTAKTKAKAQQAARMSLAAKAKSHIGSGAASAYLHTPLGRHLGTAEVLAMGASARGVSDKIDKEAMEAAKKRLENRTDLKDIAKTGMIDGQQADTYIWRAALEKVGEKMNYADNLQLAAAINERMKDKKNMSGQTLDGMMRMQQQAEAAIRKSKKVQVANDQIYDLSAGRVDMESTGNDRLSQYQQSVLEKLDTVSSAQLQSNKPDDIDRMRTAAAGALSGGYVVDAKTGQSIWKYDKSGSKFKEAQGEVDSHLTDAAANVLERADHDTMSPPLAEGKRKVMQEIVNNGTEHTVKQIVKQEPGQPVQADDEHLTSMGLDGLTRARHNYSLTTNYIPDEKHPTDRPVIRRTASDFDHRIKPAAVKYVARVNSGQRQAVSDAHFDAELRRIASIQ